MFKRKVWYDHLFSVCAGGISVWLADCQSLLFYFCFCFLGTRKSYLFSCPLWWPFWSQKNFSVFLNVWDRKGLNKVPVFQRSQLEANSNETLRPRETGWHPRSQNSWDNQCWTPRLWPDVVPALPQCGRSGSTAHCPHAHEWADRSLCAPAVSLVAQGQD